MKGEHIMQQDFTYECPYTQGPQTIYVNYMYVPILGVRSSNYKINGFDCNFEDECPYHDNCPVYKKAPVTITE